MTTDFEKAISWLNNCVNATQTTHIDISVINIDTKKNIEEQ